MARESKADQLYRQLRGLCSSLGNGARFPSVRELSRQYQVSSVIANNALKKLKEDGSVRCEIGSGTFVTSSRNENHILLLNPNWHGYSPELEAYLREEASQRGYRFKTITYDYNEEFYFNLPYHEADILIIRPSGAPLSQAHLDALASSPIPIIFVKASVEAPGIYSVGGDNVQSGRLAAQYLLSNGHRNLAFIQSEVKDITGEELYQGFMEICGQHNAQVEYISGPWEFGSNICHRVGELLKQKYATCRPSYSAAFILSDITATGAMQAFAECGIRIPQDLSLLGFGGDRNAALLTPPLSLVEVSRQEMAHSTFQIIDQLLSDKNSQPERHRISPRIVERETVLPLSSSALQEGRIA